VDTNINHTVPQRISGLEDVTVSMRVNRKLENPTVVFRQGGEVIAKRRLKRAIPAEMIRIPLKKENIRTTEAVEICVE
jgi:hypothetical protein